MALTITDECISCAACESECPNEAITEGDDIFVIETAKCTECVGFHDEPACNAVCPVECCVPDPDNKEDKDQLLAKAKQLHPDKTFD